MNSVKQRIKAFPQPPGLYKLVLPFIVIISMLLSTCYFVLTPSPAFANGDATTEASADVLPEDIELYLSINLDDIDPRDILMGEGDFMALYRYWYRDLGFTAGDPDYWLNYLKEESGITPPDWLEDWAIQQFINNYIDDWLGDEMAVAARDMSNLGEDQQPSYVVLLAVQDGKTAEFEDFFFGDDSFPGFLSVFCDAFDWGEPPTPANITPYMFYSGERVATLYSDELGIYCAFPYTGVAAPYLSPGYLILSNNANLFDDTLDLIGGDMPSNWSLGIPNSPGDTLGDYAAYDSYFPEAQANLPMDRECLLYANLADIIADFGGIPTEIEIPIDGTITIPTSLFTDFIPDFYAAAGTISSNGISWSSYSPTDYPAEFALPEIENNDLYSTLLTPRDALMFCSMEDMNAMWGWQEVYLEENWADIGGVVCELFEIPPGEWPDSLADALTETGIDVDDVILKLMSGECAFAFMPVELSDGDIAFPNFLIMFEVDPTDKTEIEGKLKTIIDAIVAEFAPSDSIIYDEAHEYDGVTGVSLTSDGIVDVGASPGWMFLENVGETGNTFLVIGSTEDVLNAAVDAKNGTNPSLDETGSYQTTLGLLPDTSATCTRMSLNYLSINGILNNVVNLMDEMDVTDEVPQEVFWVLYGMSPLNALGFSSYEMRGSSVEGVLNAAALYIHMVGTPVSPSLLGWEGFEGHPTAGPWEFGGEMNFTAFDPGIGKVDVVVEGNGEANLVTTFHKDPCADQFSGFALAVPDGYSLGDIAYLFKVDSDYTGSATITMTVGVDWVDSQGGPGNVHIFRYADDGTCQMLDTTYIYDSVNEVYTFTAVSPDGLSTFGLGSISAAAAAWGWIAGPVVGGIAIVVLAVWLFRRRAKVGA